MGYLQEYQSLDEKKRHFTIIQINTKEEFNDLYESHVGNTSGSIWRGMQESRFKLYTSLQRFWIINDLHKSKKSVSEYISHTIQFSKKWQCSFLDRYFENLYKQKVNPYSILSILRHHDSPSPLLDWSKNFRIGLYFSAVSANQFNSKNDLDNYMSLYNLNNHPIQKYDIKESIRKVFENNSDFLQQEKDKLPNANLVSDIDLKNKDHLDKFSEAYLYDERTFTRFIDDYPILKIEDSSSDIINFQVLNNYNIINQEGLFIWNFNEELPLEDSFKSSFDTFGQTQTDSQEKIDLAYKMGSVHKFVSYEIHKSLKNYVLNRLEKDGINKKYVFPDFYELAEESLNDFLINL